MTLALAVTLGVSHGFMSSLHCIVMCGPLLASVSLAGARRKTTVTVVRYNVARLAGYATVGALLGGLGFSANQLAFSSAAGILGAVILLFSAATMLWPAIIHRIPSVRSPLNLLTGGKAPGPLLLGLVTALLPCSVLYPAYAIAVAAGTMYAGAMAMTGFAFGTMITMLTIPVITGTAPRILAGISWRKPAAMMLILYSLILLAGKWKDAPEMARKLPSADTAHDDCR